MDKIRVSTISYLNTLPFVYGLQNHPIFDQIELIFDYPAACAKRLSSGGADIGIIPAAALSSIPNAKIISDYCIGGNDRVKSVILVSNTDLSSIDRVYLDYQSRTSVMLCRVLCREFWGIDPQFIDAEEGFESTTLKEGEAMVIIGDRAFEAEGRYSLTLDLSHEWKLYSNEEFVFALWVTNRELDPKFISEFNSALAYGVESIESVIDINKKSFSNIDLDTYFNRNISYLLTPSKQRGLDKFLKLIE